VKEGGRNEQRIGRLLGGMLKHVNMQGKVTEQRCKRHSYYHLIRSTGASPRGKGHHHLRGNSFLWHAPEC
jgi:hypothetical protein